MIFSFAHLWLYLTLHAQLKMMGKPDKDVLLQFKEILEALDLNVKIKFNEPQMMVYGFAES